MQYIACAIQNSAAKCWGYNRSGQLGDGTNGRVVWYEHSLWYSYTHRNVPVQVDSLTANVTAIATELVISIVVRFRTVRQSVGDITLTAD